MELMENLETEKMYEQTLLSHNGLFTIKSKMPLRDKNTLTQVYTPGVAANCLAITKDESEALSLTNKANSMIILTDYSILRGKGEGFNSYMYCPYLEAASIYYKQIANIDCYPMIVDLDHCKTSEEFQAIITAIMPAYSCIEFFGVSQSRVEKFTSQGKFSFLGASWREKREIDSELVKGQEGYEITLSVNMIYAAVIRAAMDLGFNEDLNPCVDSILEKYRKYSHGKGKSQKVFFWNLEFFHTEAIRYILDLQAKRQSKDPSEFEDRFTHARRKLINFLLHGEESWLQSFPGDYFRAEHSNDENSIMLHRKYRGIVETSCKIQVKDMELLNFIFNFRNQDHIAGILKEKPHLNRCLTYKGNYASIITNGTAILGLGAIGALSGLPVMEGKSVLFKLFGGTDVMPICIEERNPSKFIKICQAIAPSFSAINLEDIKGPDCFEIEDTLKELLEIPVFHDDQHGTAIVSLAGIVNSLRLTNRDKSKVKVIINGAGAAGLSITQLLLEFGVKDIIICDTKGAIYENRPQGMNSYKDRLAKITNRQFTKGSLSEVIKGSDIFIGVSVQGALTKDMVRSMNEKPIIFALANPIPEIYPDEAFEAGAFIMATGRSDFKNQVNNSIAFPGIFRGALDSVAREINMEMKLSAALAIAGLINEKELNVDYIIPSTLDTRVAIVVAQAVAKVGIKQAENLSLCLKKIEERLTSWMLEEKFRYWNDPTKF